MLIRMRSYSKRYCRRPSTRKKRQQGGQLPPPDTNTANTDTGIPQNESVVESSQNAETPANTNTGIPQNINVREISQNAETPANTDT